MNEEKNNIEKIAKNLKSALYKADKKKLTIEFENFPIGSCGGACDILFFFLQENGYKNIKYVCGEKSSKTHAWLEFDSFIIDITIQQFDKSITDVIFPLNSLIHKKFKITQKYIIQKPEGDALKKIPYIKELM